MDQFKSSNANLDNLSLVLHGKGDLRLEQTPIPNRLDPTECLLQTHSCGFCGTDLHLYNDGYLSDWVIKKPLVIGHESSATVVAVGDEVTHLKVGDRVAIEPAIPCFTCEICRSGRYNLCPLTNRQLRGIPPFDGCLRRYFAHSSLFCHKLPDTVSIEEGALCEPFAVTVHACRRVNLSVGHNVLVCGAGPIGMMSFLCAKAFGANKVFITDINKSRLELAKKLGADNTYLIDPKNFNDTEMAQIIKKDMGAEPDVVIECTGDEMSTSMAIYAVKKGGKVGIVGLGHPKIKVPLIYTVVHEIDIIGIRCYKDDFPLAIQLIGSGKVNLKPLITHKFKIENAVEALTLMRSNIEGSLKFMVQF